jgi:hypothetical protein
MTENAFLDRINNNPISPDEMEKYLTAIENDDAQVSFGRAVMIAKEVFDNDYNKCMSINTRMTALSILIKNDSLPGWVKPKQPDGSYQVSANIYIAAGLEPMIENEDSTDFDAESLLKRAFQLGKISS